ncbi:MAG: HAMP domain-containing sensor histidine kinase [Phycisphaerales bacterium]
MRVRRIIPWLLYVVCALAVLEGLGYAAYKALDLQRQQREEEATRLALWRMDSALTALLAAESARPYFHYQPFHAAERAYSAMLGPIEPGEVLVPSPLLTEVPPFVRLHFEIGPDGALSSPQAPEGNLRDLAEAEYVASDDVIAAEALRLMLAELLQARARSDVAMGLEPAPAEEGGADWLARNRFAAAAQLAEPPDIATREPKADAEVLDEMAELPRSQAPQPQQRQTPLSQQARDPEIHLGPLSASWLAGDELVLVREVQVGGTTLRQGVWLDWPSLRNWLLDQVRDLAPDAGLAPGAGEARSLAVIPATLSVRSGGSVLAEIRSPLGIVLLLTWCAALLAIVAIGVVLRLATSLAERRGRFVAAVTHELRTPMTSVRLYADLLESDASSDGRRRAEFAATLRQEAQRLSGIIENVLDYARLGRKRSNGQRAEAKVGQIVQCVREEQSAAVERAGMTLDIQIDPADASRTLLANDEAVVRIVSNLIENACKYAHPHTKPVVELLIRSSDIQVALTVRDWGPGVPRRERGRVFEAFYRASATELEQSGLGLGLAVSRGMAERLGGRLTIDRTPVGASFTLTVPLSPES